MIPTELKTGSVFKGKHRIGENRSMNKRERMNRIMQLVNENGTINNSDIIQLLNVSDMTIRRDLDELEKAGRLIRFHGGAQSVNYNLDF